MIHFLTTRRQNKLCRGLQTFHQLLTIVCMHTSYSLYVLLPTFSLLWPWCFALFLNENLNTEMARWNSRVCWGVESLKTSKRHCGLVPRLPPKDYISFMDELQCGLDLCEGCNSSQRECGETGITDNSIRSPSFRATHHIFCVEFFRWGWGFIQYHGQLGGPRAGKGWNLGYRKFFPVKQLILVLDSTRGPTSMKTHFLWWVRTHQWRLVRVTLSLGRFGKARSTSHLSGSPQLP